MMTRPDGQAPDHSLLPLESLAADTVMPGGLSPDDALTEEFFAGFLAGGGTAALLTVLRSEPAVAGYAGTRSLHTGREFTGPLVHSPWADTLREAALRCLESRCPQRILCLPQDSSRPSAVDSMDVFCEILEPSQAGLFALAARCQLRNERGLWTVEPAGQAPLRRLCLEYPPAGHTPPQGLAVDAEAVRGLLEECKNRPALVRRGQRPVYLEPLSAPPVLLLAGGGDEAVEVGRLARQCGFVVDVVDHEPDFASATRFPFARNCLTLPGYTDLVRACAIGRSHFVLVMLRNHGSRDHGHDLRILEQVLSSHAHYIGLTGSRNRREHMFATLHARGIPRTELAAVRCPAGLAVESMTPAQTAVAIVAELLAVRAGTLNRLRLDE